MPESQSIEQLRAAYARAVRQAKLQPDDASAAAIASAAQLTYITEKTLQDVADSLGALALDGDTRRRLQDGLARILGDAA